MKNATALIVVMALLIGSSLAVAQEKGGGQAPAQPMMGQGMMCPCMMMPQMVQNMQKMMPMMEQIVKEKMMTPKATKQMQDKMTQMQGMMTQMQGMMQKMPMMQMMQQQSQAPQKSEEERK